MKQPTIIQGGMGIAVSNWRLARQVSLLGELGVVSGTAINSVLVRRLQDGDPGGHMREALAHFPSQEVANEILKSFFQPNGRVPGRPYKLSPTHSLTTNLALDRLTVASSFAEVYCAKQGHDGLVGINLLEKIQLPNLSCLYGAMLAGVDYVIMGAGIPREIPGVLDLFSTHQEASLRIHVEDADDGDDFRLHFDPKKTIPLEKHEPLTRPQFLAVVSSVTLANSLAKKASGYVDGFVIENWTAGGHNAPPRGAMQLSEKGEPIYGPKDDADLKAFREIGRPFWLAGSHATPEKLKAALAEGATGIQIGTLFAFSSDSGLSPRFKEKIQDMILKGEKPKVFTDPLASPTGFPFKAVNIEGTTARASTYIERPRICDLGYLRTAYKQSDGFIGFRCASEPVQAFLSKGGDLTSTEGRKCLCNGLMATIDMPQVRKAGYEEPAMVTAGDDLAELGKFSKGKPYSAKDVINYIRGKN